MKKLATKLTPAIKAWIKEEFGSDSYDSRNECLYFHFPNHFNYSGYVKWHHAGSEIEKDYTEVSEQEFLNEFSTKKPKRGDLVLVRGDDSQEWVQRIFLTEIVGAEYPYVVVAHGYEKEFKNNEIFNYAFFTKIQKIPLEKITIEQANDILKQFNKQI